jgi:Amt family ammonium transporter
VFVVFQATFAAITCCLIVGAFAERIKFSAVLLFMVLWFTFSYAPIAHMVWYWAWPGRLHQQGRWSTAINAKAAWRGSGARSTSLAAPWCTSTPPCRGLGGCLHGRQARRLRHRKRSRPHCADADRWSGPSLLWVGWFGLNAGSALESPHPRCLAFIIRSRPLPRRCWPGVSVKPDKGKASMLGAASAQWPAGGNHSACGNVV